MRYIFLKRFVDELEVLPEETQDKFSKQLKLLLLNIRHPSLRAKKYDEGQNIWQARIDKSWRFYFRITADCFVLLMVRRHKD